MNEFHKKCIQLIITSLLFRRSRGKLLRQSKMRLTVATDTSTAPLSIWMKKKSAKRWRKKWRTVLSRERNSSLPARCVQFSLNLTSFLCIFCVLNLCILVFTFYVFCLFISISNYPFQFIHIFFLFLENKPKTDKVSGINIFVFSKR